MTARRQSYSERPNTERGITSTPNQRSQIGKDSREDRVTLAAQHNSRYVKDNKIESRTPITQKPTGLHSIYSSLYAQDRRNSTGLLDKSTDRNNDQPRGPTEIGRSSQKESKTVLTPRDRSKNPSRLPSESPQDRNNDRRLSDMSALERSRSKPGIKQTLTKQSNKMPPRTSSHSQSARNISPSKNQISPNNAPENTESWVTNQGVVVRTSTPREQLPDSEDQNSARRKSSPKDTSAFFESLKKSEEKKRQTHEKLLQKYSSSRDDICTFHPQINPASQNKRRSVQEFVQDQEAFQVYSNYKKIKLQEEMEEARRKRESLSPPRLNEVSRMIVEHKRKQSNDQRPAYERLYENKYGSPFHLKFSPRQTSPLQGREEGDSSSRGLTNRRTTFDGPPKSQNTSRSRSPHEAASDLYADAEKRQGKANKTLENHMKDLKAQHNTSYVNQQSNKILAQSLIKEYEKQTSLIFQDSEHKGKFDYSEMVCLLKSLNFVSNIEGVKDKSTNTEWMLLDKIWLILQGDQHDGINERNLLIFLLAILGLNPEFSPYKLSGEPGGPQYESIVTRAKKAAAAAKDNSSETQANNGLIGKFDEKENVVFTPKDISTIQKTFELFYVNRTTLAKNLSASKNPSLQISTGSPRIPEMLEQSKNLAAAYREKQLEEVQEYLQENNMPFPEKMDHAELLRLHAMATAEKTKKKLLKEKEEEEFQECTFKPKINGPEAIQKLRASSPPSKGGQQGDTSNLDESKDLVGNNQGFKSTVESLGIQKRTELLYSMGKKQLERSDKSHVEWYDEKNINFCTFKPALTARRTKDDKISLDDVRSADKSIERMRNGRDQQEVADWAKGERPHTMLKVGIERIHNKARIGDVNTKDLTHQDEPPKSSRESISNKYMSRKLSESKLSPQKVYEQSQKSSRHRSKSPGTSGSDRKPVSTQDTPMKRTGSMKKRESPMKNHLEKENEQKMHQRENYKTPKSILKGSPNRNGGPENRKPIKLAEKSGNNRLAPNKKLANEPIREVDDDEHQPYLCVDVNFKEGEYDRIDVYEGDDPEVLAERFALEKNLDERMKRKLKKMLEEQINKYMPKSKE